ncbi:D-alanyl-D-alanine carboxypeptidase/D-alanyl-D-alanine endopeptidase [Roseateles oligotrophus]|uniref:D-alanyl-D-alanine carboxypeptidase/D-alanyl-D-alanine-endopeptidase n=1 Tax=Roseateles oligotrophus TaxID=1769250 RepID=A0ABT2YCI8_9BURK|nr:D-alanyl-D-alanine carboxypeptidase/D-alanyl-D-alanine-endopeptidase [Roseateles oligotrophus]MCV2367749.1 D-alanyl-D-alanine carboxypeptidase/D-alanyl-D-alanine-endopeptidase [Roseateles oligotrophus]
MGSSLRLRILCVGALLANCAALAMPPLRLPAEVRLALAKAGLPESAMAVHAFPLQQAAQILSVRGQEAISVGSAMKLVTAVVAMDRLGAASRGRTDLLVDGNQTGDVLNGSLYLRGGADAELDWGVLWQMLRVLREQQGLREIQGGLVVDRTLFSPARPELGVPAFDESPEWPYNVIPDALHLNGSLLGYTLRSDASSVSAKSSPAWPGIGLDVSGMTLVDRPCVDWEQGWRLPMVRQDGSGATIELKGEFPRHCEQRPKLNLLDRQWLSTQAVRQIWAELGGSMGPANLEGATPVDARLLASHQDRPLGELLRAALKQSDNPLSRLVFLRLGAAVAEPGEATQAAAARAVSEWFAAKHIDSEGLVLDNGAGLSRSERIKPAQLAALLAAAWDGPLAPELLSGLPLAGVDGTLTRRFKGGPAEGRARLKTGTLRDVKALAGYVYDRRRRPWVLVVAVNHAEAAKGRAAMDALVEWLASRR